MAFFKTADEIFAQGQDLINRGDFNGALLKFNDAAQKYSKQGDSQKSKLASTYASIMAISGNQLNPDTYRFASKSLNELGDVQIRLGLRDSTSTQLAQEINLLAEDIESSRFQATIPKQHEEKAKKQQELALKFRTQIADSILAIPDIFNRQVIKGETKALILMAESEQSLGESLISTDPKAAAEHYQRAKLWWMQAGNQELADWASARVNAYGKAARCWFCGREVSGEGVHYVHMPSDITDLLRKGTGETTLPSYDPVSGEVYACKGCQSAIYKTADFLSIKRMTELENRLMPKIQELGNNVAQLNNNVAQLRSEVNQLRRMIR